MDERKSYWPTREHAGGCHGSQLDLRCSLAWDLLSHFGVVTGIVNRQDDAGRAICDPMPPAEVVARCFALADGFVDAAEQRGGIRAVTEEQVEAAFARGGSLEATRCNARERGQINALEDFAKALKLDKPA